MKVHGCSNIPLNMQKGNEHSIKKVRRAFFALFVKTIFSKFWVSGQFYDLLGKYWWCYSTQKNAPVHF